MMYVIYNNDGSIKSKFLNEFVMQGNNNVNELFVAIEGREDYSLYASFKLPNGSTTTVVSSTPTTEFIEGLGTFTGRKILLSNAETLVAGALQMNVVCLDENDTKIVAFSTYITVNETGIQLNDPVLLTVQEYENLISEIKAKMSYPTKYVQVTTLPDNPDLDTIYVLKGEDDLNEVFMFNGKTESWIPLGSNRINLGNYYTKEEGEEFEEGIDQRVSSVENELSSVASGSPKGVYATLAALQAAYPTGTTGIYVVSADGHWYYWSGSAWTDGGVYLSVLPDAVLDGDSTNSIQNKVVTLNFNSVNKKLEKAGYINGVWANKNITTISSGSLVYINDTHRITNEAGTWFNLKRGTVISLSDYTKYRFYLYVSYDNGVTWEYNGSWRSEDYVVPQDACYVVTVAGVENSESSIIGNNLIPEIEVYQNEDYNSKIEFNNKKIVLNTNDEKTLIDVSLFQSGYRNSSSHLDVITKTNNRFTTTNALSFNREVTIEAQAGFLIYAYIPNEDGITSKRTVGWASKVFVYADESVIIDIKRSTEITEIADIYEFVSAINVTSKLTKDYTLKTLYDKQVIDGFNTGNSFFNVEWVHGEMDGNTRRYFAFRVQTKEINHLDYDLSLNIAPNFRIYVYYYNSVGVYQTGSGWQTGSFIIAKGTYFRITIARITENTSEIADYVEFVSSLTTIIPFLNDKDFAKYDIPSYWYSQLQTKTGEIIDKKLVVGSNGVSFFFITDNHWEGNAKRSPNLLNYLCYQTQIRDVFCGGDAMTASTSKQGAINALVDFMNSYKKENFRFIPTVGNHDYNTQGGTGALSESETYALLLKPSEYFAINNKQYLCTYLDNETQKVRYIMFNRSANGSNGITSHDTEIKAWLQEKIQELPAGWKVILFTHIFLANDDGEAEPYAPADAQAYASFLMGIEANAEILFLVCGHMHEDAVVVTNGLIVIATQCDIYSGSAPYGGYTMTKGTDTEQAFDCYQVDFENRKVYITRIGAGLDREVDY